MDNKVRVRYYIGYCADCGKEVQTRGVGGHDTLCEEHKLARRKEREQRRNEEKREINSMRSRRHKRGLGKLYMVVVYDPDELGGFCPNAIISCREVSLMCSPSYQAFNEGTKLRDAKGNLYIVRTMPNLEQKLIPVT